MFLASDLTGRTPNRGLELVDPSPWTRARGPEPCSPLYRAHIVYYPEPKSVERARGPELVDLSSWTRARGPELVSCVFYGAQIVARARGPELVDPSSWTRGKEPWLVP